MKDIKGYEGLYAVTSCGKVWSHRRHKFMAQRYDKDGYLRISLMKDGKLKTYQVHRLVAEAYIPNPENKPEVNHKNEIKTSNFVQNLEWMTKKENLNYGTRQERLSKTLGIKVYCVETDKVYQSMSVAAKELGICATGIGKCCMGEYKQTHGYHFKYANI